jgi:hypothetical protein
VKAIFTKSFGGTAHSMAPRPLTLIADSVKTFTGLVVEIEKKWAGDSNESGLWYRGHTEKTWELLPKFYREVENPTIRDEDDIREGFVIRAPHLTSEKPQNEWEWYFLMQHYGAHRRDCSTGRMGRSSLCISRSEITPDIRMLLYGSLTPEK